jgi:ribonuclease HII
LGRTPGRAAVILPRDFDPDKDPKVRDSKSMSRAQRAAAYPRILAEAIAVSVMWVTASAIDDASEKREFDASHVQLLRNAIRSLTPQPAHVLIDSLEVPGLSMSHQSIAHGDLRNHRGGGDGRGDWDASLSSSIRP